MNAKENKDEIDLMETAVKIVRFFISNWLFIGSFVILVPAMVYGFHLFRGQDYDAHMSMRFEEVTTEETLRILNQFKNVANPGPSDNVQNLTIEVVGRKGADVNYTYAEIYCTTRDTTVLRPTEKLLIDYLRHQAVLTEYANERAWRTAELIKQYDDKIKKAETILNSMKDISVINLPDLMTLYDRRTRAQQQSTAPIFKVLLPFSAVPKPPLSTKTLAMSAAFGLILAFLILFLRFFISYYKKVSPQIA